MKASSLNENSQKNKIELEERLYLAKQLNHKTRRANTQFIATFGLYTNCCGFDILARFSAML